MKGNKFIIQEFIADKSNHILKCRSIFGWFACTLNEGIVGIEEQTTQGEFFQRPALLNPAQKKTFLSSEHMDDAKEFQLSLARRLGAHLIGLDFLLLSTGVMMPIDLNKQPRIDRMSNIERILNRSFIKRTSEPRMHRGPSQEGSRGGSPSWQERERGSFWESAEVRNYF